MSAHEHIDIVDLQDDVKVMVDYLDLKRRQRDWHGVRDACVDIETIEARIATHTSRGASGINSRQRDSKP
jgi:hypothetical protein